MRNQYNIQCPACEHEFNVEEAIATKVEQGYKENLKKKEEELKSEFKLKVTKLNEREGKLKEAEKLQEQLIAERIKEREAELLKKAEEQLSSKYESKMKMLEEDVESKGSQLKKLQRKELQLVRKEREILEANDKLELEFEKRLLRERESIKGEVSRGFEEKKAIEMQEKEILIKQLKERIDDMKRKTDQSSMQVQGEAQEIALEEILRAKFPVDLIQEVAKGVKGADSLQTVRNDIGKDCGMIVYESKRTKKFSHEWIKKLKEDTLRVKGNISVLVTEALPDSIQGMGQIDGVWVTDFTNLGNLTTILRFAIIKEYNALDHQVNKGDKMQMLYDYLTSNEFGMQMRSIVEGFTSMRTNLDKQRNSMNAHWKKQEKEIERVVESTVNMYGSVRGIGGSAIEEIKQLELSEEEGTLELNEANI
jgi:hypothetical protein